MTGVCSGCHGQVPQRPDGSHTCPRCDPGGLAALYSPPPSAEPLVPVRFLRAAGIYQAGEVAGFPAWRAVELVAAAAAEPYQVELA